LPKTSFLVYANLKGITVSRMSSDLYFGLSRVPVEVVKRSIPQVVQYVSIVVQERLNETE